MLGNWVVPFWPKALPGRYLNVRLTGTTGNRGGCLSLCANACFGGSNIRRRQTALYRDNDRYQMDDH